MYREKVLHVLNDHADDIRRRFGVRSLSLFGSVVRGEATHESDVDLLVEFDRPVGYFHLFRLQDHLERLLGGTMVDLIPRASVVPELQETIYGEAIDVFGDDVGVPA